MAYEVVTVGGSDIIVDDISGVGKIQVMKLDVGGDGATSPVLLDVTGKLPATVQGTHAHDAVDSGNPIKIGGKVLVDSEATPTEVAVGDRVDAWLERDGAQVTSNREAVRQDATWTSATGVNTALELDCSRMGSGIIWMRPSGTVTAGALTFECSVNGGTSWVPLSGTNGNRIQTGVTLGGVDYWNGAEAGWRFPVQAMDRIRVRLSTVITGAGSVFVSVRATSVATNPFAVTRSSFSQQSGTITGSGTNVVDIEAQDGSPVLQISNSGTAWTGTIVFEQSPDGASWTPAIAFEQTTFSGIQGSTTANGIWNFVGSSGMRYLRARGGGITNTAAILWSGGSVGSDTTLAIVCGDKGHDGADLGTFPIKMGGRAIAHGASPTAVAADDRTSWYFNRHGVPWVIGGHPNVLTFEYRATTARTDTDIIGAIAAGTRLIITAIQVVAANATTVDVGVRIGFGATAVPTEPSDGASVIGVLFSHPGIAPGSGAGRGDGSGIIGIGGDGQELRATNTVPTTGSIKIITTCYVIES